MIYVIDTHASVWYVDGSPKISPRAFEAMASAASGLVIPSIVMAEAWHLYQHKRIRISPQDVRSRILSVANCSIYPLDEAVLEMLPAGLDIHDAVIVATALVYRDVLRQPTQLVTRDQMIADSKLIDVLW